MVTFRSGPSAKEWKPARFVFVALALASLLAGTYNTYSRGISTRPSGTEPAVAQAPIFAAAAAGGSGDSGGGSSGQAASWRASAHVNATHVAAYKPSLSPRELDRGLVSFGDKSRARRVAAKLLAGLPVSVAFFGGSVTTGSFAPNPDANGYVALTLEWINRIFPHPKHRLKNSGWGLTPSNYFALCPNKEAPPDVDLVFLEFNINDSAFGPGHPVRLAHERLIRKLLAFANRPALVEFVFFRHPEPNITHSVVPVPYRGGGDEELGVLAQYYHLPWLSARSLVWDGLRETQADPAAREKRSKFDALWNSVDGFKLDSTHPGGHGHGWLSELIVHWLTQVLEDVWQHPVEAEDEEEAQRPLNIPMYKNNFELPGNNTCLVGEEVKQLVSSHDAAFEWVNEGTVERPKWGYVSLQAGSSLTLKLSTVVPGKGPENKVQVGIAHLRSYEHMGKFAVSCIEGCTCEPMTVDGHIKEPFSQMFFSGMQVSSSDACMLKLTVLNDTQSGEHKVKLLGVVLGEHEDMLGFDPNGEMIRAMPDLH